MKKNNKVSSPKKSEDIKEEPETSSKKTKQGGANPTFPQEYEEQAGMDIRMKPQPFVKPKK
jgi:hypothetical protein